jgi:hypothetical protein
MQGLTRSLVGGERFDALLAKHGVTEKALAAARSRLAAHQRDDAARLRVAYCLRAMGKAAEAESTPREIAWGAFPDRERRAPMPFAPFP